MPTCCAHTAAICVTTGFQGIPEVCSAQRSKLLLADTGLFANETEEVGCFQTASAQGGHVGGESDIRQGAPPGSQSQVHPSCIHMAQDSWRVKGTAIL